ncbi:hypothetical protein GCM10007079_45550 [Nocardiopsis terrae]|uniref:Uncharacterized protein n=1 Tax=Nocardiopsis terrae TaxID=372655 RepID=A0ABR9HKU2_9ACTN|nr:hypothetical protein [Nocardiopsis terrae]MBE1459635.1 hypothetical protein [Nocardiopsis terrae]GHC94759.1 hypothetical protein GCM10007079_45550 [Nocardiopsis terrae]
MTRGSDEVPVRPRSRAVALGVAASTVIVLGTSLWAYAGTRGGPEPADYVTDTSEEGTVDQTTELRNGTGDDAGAGGGADTDPALRGAGVELPEGWAEADERTALHDDEEVTVRRYQVDGERVLGESHLSVVLGEDDRIVGVTLLDAGAAGDPDDLPTHDQARETAYNWLARQDSDYLEGLTEQWVDRHDEVVVDAEGRERVIPGVKVKTRHDDGRYAWVIVGAGARIVTFERDVTWDSSAQRRSTQMWLHDRWIAAVEGTGEHPPAPAAVADPG